MLTVIYGLIIIAATFLGAFVGLGGGVVIKPLLDLIGKSPIDVVNFISSCAVFAMSISSTAQHIKAKTKIKTFLTADSLSACAPTRCTLLSRCNAKLATYMRH